MRKAPLTLAQETIFLIQEARLPCGWLGKKYCSHFKSHNISTKQTLVMHKAGHILLKEQERFEKEKQTLLRHPEANSSIAFGTGKICTCKRMQLLTQSSY